MPAPAPASPKTTDFTNDFSTEPKPAPQRGAQVHDGHNVDEQEEEDKGRQRNLKTWSPSRQTMG